jgi:hypothetical protein
MGNLTNKYIKDTYDGLIKLADEYNGVTPDLQSLQDGLGNDIPIKVSQTEVVITGSLAGNATSSDTSVSASHAVQADSASYVLGLNVDGPVLILLIQYPHHILLRHHMQKTYHHKVTST